MARTVAIISFFYFAAVFGQNADSIKLDEHKFLDMQEAEVLNSILVESRGSFDFRGKKLAFVTGSSGSRIISKSDYFETCIFPWLDKGESPQIFIVELTKEEKDRSGGYDALVLSWVKVFTRKQKRRIIKKLVNEKE